MRYEDDRTTPDRPFVCGLTLESFHGVTVDANGTPAFVQESGGTLHKLVELRNFAVYWNPRGEPLRFSSGLEMGAALNQLICKGNCEPDSLQYLLRPVSGRLRLAMLRDTEIKDFATPQYFFDFLFDHIHIVLRDAQYQDFAALAEGFRLHARRAPYLALLKRPGLRPKLAPREWWQYAMRAVLHDLREARRQWSWERMLQRKQNRQRYILLFCEVKRDELKPNSPQADGERVALFALSCSRLTLFLSQSRLRVC
jgi:vacuolar protein sorting-associated protein 13A/C